MVKVLVYQFFETYDPETDNCDARVASAVSRGVFAAYEKLTAAGLSQNTFDDIVCAQIDRSLPDHQALAPHDGTVVFIDSSQDPQIALFRLERNQLSIAQVAHLVLAMHELQPVAGRPGEYADGQGNTVKAEDLLQRTPCPTWANGWLCNPLGTQSWTGLGLRVLQWIAMLLLIIALWNLLKR